MEYRLLDSKTMYEGKVFRVRVDRVQYPSGRSLPIEVVEHGGAVAILPLDEENRIWFIRQYRHPAGQILLEIPAGTLQPGEDPQACAIRECQEEIGMAPGRLTPLGSFFLAPGYSSELLHVFLAEKLVPQRLPGDADEDITVERVALEQALVLLSTGELHDAKTLAAILLTLAHRRQLQLSTNL